MTRQSNIQFRNKNLYNKYRDFIITSFQELDKNLINEELKSQTSREAISITEEDSYLTYSEQEPNFHKFIYQHENKIKQLSEYDSCIKLIIQDSVIKYKGKVVDSKGAPIKIPNVRPFYENELLYFLVRFAEKTESFNFDDEKFIEFYKEYEDFLYDDEITYKSFSPLDNFQSEVERIDLGDNLIIKKISNEEFKELWRATRYNMLHVTPFEISKLKFLIESKYTIKKGASQSEEIPNDTFEKVISVLRLLKEGVIGFNLIFSSSSIWTHTGTIVSGGLYNKCYIGSQYKLMKFEIDDFIKLWTEFKKINGRSDFLDVAISRFNYVYGRERPEDKLIDCMIAFEALFSEGSGDLSYKVPIRVARLLETGFEQRKNVYIKMKAGYNARSKLVHGNKHIKYIDLKSSNGSEKILLTNFIPIIIEYLRKSLKEILNEVGNGKDKKDILEKIDFII